ncbi:protein ORF17 [Lake sturgeon herpesvirus]|nr:protein ORF17 [Lake sturgeon herpesvirus]
MNGDFCLVPVFKTAFKTLKESTLCDDSVLCETLEQQTAKQVVRNLLQTDNYYSSELKYKSKTICRGKVLKRRHKKDTRTLKMALRPVFWTKLCASPHVIEVTDVKVPFYNKPFECRWYERHGVKLTRQTPNLPHVLKGVLSAMAHLHDNIKLYHRNIQASSVVVVDGEAKLRDFQEASCFPWTKHCCSKKSILAPEMLMYKVQLPAKTDIWSFGMMVWGLYGKTCFDKFDKIWFSYEYEQYLQNVFTTRQACSKRHPEVNVLLEQTLQLDPTKRSTISELQKLAFFG